MPNVFDGVVGIAIVARAMRPTFLTVVALRAVVSVRALRDVGCAVRATVLALRAVDLSDCLFDFADWRTTVFFVVLRAVMPRADVFSVFVRDIIFFCVLRVIDVALRSAASTGTTLTKNAMISNNIFFILSTINIMLSEMGIFNK